MVSVQSFWSSLCVPTQINKDDGENEVSESRWVVGSLVTPKTQFYLQLDYLRLLNCLVGFVFSLVCSWRMVLMSLCCRLLYLPWEGWHFKGNFFANVNGSPNMHGSFSKNGPFYLIKLSLAMQFLWMDMSVDNQNWQQTIPTGVIGHSMRSDRYVML